MNQSISKTNLTDEISRPNKPMDEKSWPNEISRPNEKSWSNEISRTEKSAGYMKSKKKAPGPATAGGF